MALRTRAPRLVLPPSADGTASGVTITATASLIAGGASAANTAGSVTLTATASFIAGSAVGDGSGGDDVVVCFMVCD